MIICKKCGREFPTSMVIDGKRRNLSKRKFCLECSPFRTYNRKDLLLYNDDSKVCSSCSLSKPLSEYYARGDGQGSYCKVCQKLYVSKRNRDHKSKAVDFLGGCCCLCGYDTCIDALEFHHKDPSSKDFSIAKARNRSLERILIEVSKCVLLCSNCHREVHASLRVIDV